MTMLSWTPVFEYTRTVLPAVVRKRAPSWDHAWKVPANPGVMDGGEPSIGMTWTDESAPYCVARCTASGAAWTLPSRASVIDSTSPPVRLQTVMLPRRVVHA
ncbi:hypothetical protein WME89_25645 [Sorangium sp. So ce321]|uniref:hypothetical protein n=1 Tax=Sorangium sp. So ce321 TaxID=3133300 RepID=UPI003F647E41